MTVFNFGSINVDHFYRLPHLSQPGETLTATGYNTGLGGKGANQSVAVAKAGVEVHHIGMVGSDGAHMRQHLGDMGVNITYVNSEGTVTGHANIYVDPDGENEIVVFPGANHEQSLSLLKRALDTAKPGDFFMMQNEITLKLEAARLAQEKGLFVVYSAAPFKADVAREMLPFADLLVLNEVESEQLSVALGVPVDEIPVPSLLITKGAQGAVWYDHGTGETLEVSAIPVQSVDTTGAGDCFIGYVVAGLDQGMTRSEALRFGSAAAALQVTRPGTADAIPARDEVDAFLAEMETK